MATCLKGEALIWFEPMWQNYLEYRKEDREKKVQAIFAGGFPAFEKAIKAALGDLDEERIVERQLMSLKQTGSASVYTVKFRQMSSTLDWDDEPLIVAFYSGLKSEVKDKIVKMDRPKEFADYVALVVHIDNRLYKQQLEQKGQYQLQPHHLRNANQGKKVA